MTCDSKVVIGRSALSLFIAPLITSITTPKGLGNRKVKGASDQLSNLKYRYQDFNF